jgi:hypothetical protein
MHSWSKFITDLINIGGGRGEVGDFCAADLFSDDSSRVFLYVLSP